MRIQNLTLNLAVIEPQFNGRADILFRTGIINLDLISARLQDLGIPDNLVLRAGPVREEGAVGKSVRPLDIAVSHAVAGGDLCESIVRMSDEKGAFVSIIAVEHGLSPIGCRF